jgi:hypothetical protein
VSTLHLDIEAVAINCDHVRKLVQLRNQFEHIFFKRPPERFLLILSDRHGQTERADVRPTPCTSLESRSDSMSK